MLKLRPLPPGTPPPAEGAPYSCGEAWARLYRGLYRYDLRDFALERDGRPAGGFRCAVVRSLLFGDRLVSLPFSDEPGLWFAPGAAPSPGEAAELRAELARALDGLMAETGARCAELRGADFLEPGGDALFEETAPYLRLVLDASRPYAELRAGFSGNIPTNLRKADKHVSVAESRDPAAFAAVYGIYLRQMRLFGSPPLPAAHFEELLRAGAGRLYTASVGGRPAALLFAQVWDGAFYADVNAGLPEFAGFFPKVKLFDETLRRACAEGLRRYDFMRTRAGTGVHGHKKKWGGAELPIRYFYRYGEKGARPSPDPEQARFALPRLLLRRAPLALLAALGPSIRRQAGK